MFFRCCNRFFICCGNCFPFVALDVLFDVPIACFFCYVHLVVGWLRVELTLGEGAGGPARLGIGRSHARGR